MESKMKGGGGRRTGSGKKEVTEDKPFLCEAFIE